MNWTLHLWNGGTHFQIFTLYVLDTPMSTMGWQEEHLTMQKCNFKMTSFDMLTEIANQTVERLTRMEPPITSYQNSHPLEYHLLEFYTLMKRWLPLWLVSLLELNVRLVKWSVPMALLGTGLNKSNQNILSILTSQIIVIFVLQRMNHWADNGLHWTESGCQEVLAWKSNKLLSQILLTYKKNSRNTNLRLRVF